MLVYNKYKKKKKKKKKKEVLNAQNMCTISMNAKEELKESERRERSKEETKWIKPIIINDDVLTWSFNSIEHDRLTANRLKRTNWRVHSPG